MTKTHRTYRFLLTTLPTNDLGLLTRSLPIAKELSDRGHEVIFSNPAAAPRQLIAAAGFDNLIPTHPLYEVGFNRLNLKTIFCYKSVREKYGGSLRFFTELIKSIPIRFAKTSDEIWDMDHASAITGLLNQNFIKAQCLAYQKSERDLSDERCVANV